MTCHLALARRTRNQTPPQPGTGPAGAADTDARDPVVRRMAITMNEIVAAAGSCDAYDLAEAGFSPAEIIEHAPAARTLAMALADEPADVEVVR